MNEIHQLVSCINRDQNHKCKNLTASCGRSTRQRKMTDQSYGDHTPYRNSRSNITSGLRSHSRANWGPRLGQVKNMGAVPMNELDVIKSHPFKIVGSHRANTSEIRSLGNPLTQVKQKTKQGKTRVNNRGKQET